MCLFRPPRPKNAGWTPAVTPIAKTDTSLPEGQVKVKEGETAKVAYGNEKTTGTNEVRQDASSLAINLPNATAAGAKTGGLNTNEIG